MLRSILLRDQEVGFRSLQEAHGRHLFAAPGIATENETKSENANRTKRKTRSDWIGSDLVIVLTDSSWQTVAAEVILKTGKTEGETTGALLRQYVQVSTSSCPDRTLYQFKVARTREKCGCGLVIHRTVTVSAFHDTRRREV